MLKPVNVELNTKNYSHFSTQYFRSFILLLLSFSFILLSSVKAQVIIKEKVEIKPSTTVLKKGNPNSITATNYNMHIRFEMVSNKPDHLISLSVISGAKRNTTGWQTGGKLLLDFNADTTVTTDFKFLIEGKFGINDEYTRIGVYYKIYFNGNLADSSEIYLYRYQPYRYLDFYPPFANDFKLFLNSNGNDGNHRYGSLYIVPIRNSTDNYWRTDEPMSFTIANGSELCQFASVGTNTLLGSSILSTVLKIDDYYLYADTSLISGVHKKITITATANNGLTKSINSEIWSYIIGYLGKVIIQKGEKLNVSAWLTYSYFDGKVVNLPEGTTFTAEIIQGSEYGELINPQNDSTGNYLSGITAENNKINIKFYANGNEALTNQEIKVRISSSLANIEPLDLVFTVSPAGVVVTFEPEELTPGDTASITIQHRKTDGTLEDFPSDEDYEVQLIEGGNYGTILSSNGVDTSDYFGSVTAGIKFIAYNNIDTNNVDVRLKVSTLFDENNAAAISVGDNKNPAQIVGDNKIWNNRRIDGKSNTDKNKVLSDNRLVNKNNGKNKNGITNIVFPPTNKEIYGIGKAKIKQEAIEILLGETKYFGVKKKDNEYKIEAIKTDYGLQPKFPDDTNDEWKWQKISSVWGSAPIEKLGTKSGIYWGKKWFDKSDNKNKPLEAGMIRMIGRYWETGKEDSFKVKLKTTNNAKLEIKVVKPNELGNTNHKPKDVFGNPIITIDDSCIVTGGKYGIPPQIIKGQMQKETSFRNSFRYEPGLDIRKQKNNKVRKKYLEDYPYYTVTSTDMGTIAVPKKHKNVKPVAYITTPTKVKDYLYTNLSQYIGQLKNGELKGEPYFLGDYKKKLSHKIQYYYEYARKILKSNTPYQDSKDSLKEWLKRGEFENGNQYVQTRIFSSYGMLQQVFYFACTDKLAGYSISNDSQTPESLNEMSYSLKAYSEKMKKKLKNKTDNNWDKGFEEEWIKILRSYNHGEAAYGKDVLEFSKLYLPKK